jgi:hypothetical protein
MPPSKTVCKGSIKSIETIKSARVSFPETKNPFPYSTAVLTCLKAVFKSFEASFQFY